MNYFAKDARFISRKALSSEDSFFRCTVFVLATIQQAFYTVPMIMERIEKEGVESRFLFGAKREGYEFASSNRYFLMTKAEAFMSEQITLEELIAEYMEIPGLGVAKASFLAQLTVGDGACLDRHNLRILGLPESFTKASKDLKPASIMRRITIYNETWRKCGDSAYWWNSWCDFVASNYPKKFRNGSEVSAMHRVAV